jgi:glycosyltransferase involved in cell wall biosynthesis
VTSEPSLAIVTPSMNQVDLIEATLLSVLDGGSPPEELVVVDGGSTDGTAKIVERYSERLSWWVSERDGGQYDAVEKGFAHTQSDVMGWLNAGDLFMPWTISVVRELFATFPHVDWLTTQRPLIADDQGRIVSCEFIGGFAADSFRAGVNLPGGTWFARAGIQQESTFWRRSLWERAGERLATELHYAGDFELWLRFFEHARPYALDAPLAAHRVHAGQKTETLDQYVAEASRVLSKAGYQIDGRLSDASRRTLYNALGRRPLRRLPRLVALPLEASGLLENVQTIVWREGDWKIVGDYAV